jgi:signal transduction histidine kinase
MALRPLLRLGLERLGMRRRRGAGARSATTFELSEHDGQSTLAVADDGPGIPPGQRDAVFKRFTRLDEARARDSGGVGLGLAIVQDIVRRHRGTVAVMSSEPGGARLVVRLPTTA